MGEEEGEVRGRVAEGGLKEMGEEGVVRERDEDG
jgi:hypothetical protein